MRTSRISLCLIARDEEALLPGCLESVRGAVDEVVLVDTGSVDRTRDVARAAGARVLERPWDHDFAAPRNLAVEQASGDWILQLDADERLVPGAATALRGAAGRGGFDVGFVRLHNASRLDAPPEAVVSGQDRHGAPALLPRLIRRAPDLRYEGIVHESVSDWAAARGNQLKRVDVDLVHLGYVQSLHTFRDKRRRNLELLSRRAESEPANIAPLGYWAAELVATREWAAAAEVAERGWALMPQQPPHRPVRRLAVARAVAAVNLGAWARVVESVDLSERRDGANPDYAFLRGCAWEGEAGTLPAGSTERAALLARAAEAFRQSLAEVRRGGWMQVMVASEPDALLRLGAIRLKAGDLAGASQSFAQAGEAGAGAAALRGELEVRIAGGDPAGALARLQPILEAGGDAASWSLAAKAALALGANRDAALFLARARTFPA